MDGLQSTVYGSARSTGRLKLKTEDRRPKTEKLKIVQKGP